MSSDDIARDRIIRATNNQSPVEISSLHATDKIQRDIEVILDRCGWYYERRRNYYRNIGRPAARFVTPIYLASAAVALVLRNPKIGADLKPKFMRSQGAYENVFSSTLPIEVWPIIVEVYKAVDAVLLQHAIPVTRERYHARFAPWSPSSWSRAPWDICVFSFPACWTSWKAGPIAPDEALEAWQIVSGVTKGRIGARLRAALVLDACESAAKQFSLEGVESVGKRGVLPPHIDKPPRDMVQAPPPSQDLVDDVDRLLPPQPWKVGVHREVAASLGVQDKVVSDVIQLLIASGRRNQQRDGVVYAPDGKVLAVDASRPKRRE
ncbi:MAG: AIPR family protein [Gemmatimonadetes bacterium]|nr:AIPR family protein [Gemmatimonadota bacterium]